MKIYLDNCALGRLFDERSQPRIAAEAQAVETILRAVESGTYRWIASDALQREISQNSDIVRRFDTLRLLTWATEVLSLTPQIQARSKAIEQLGFTSFDAQHLSFAEDAQVNVMLTTDDRLLRRGARCNRQNQLAARLANPVDWLREVTRG